ncbi:MAG TPA: protein kinase [Kofleriaceae bacterium]|nr:protein kinase [Kofleriaceae bacterium]
MQVGEVVGNYRITGKLGSGGMGAVYLAKHTLIGREAAIKVLLPALCDNETVVARFFNEAKTTTAIKHPGIVEVFDFGYARDGSAYLVMERLEGESLGARLQREGHLPVDQAVSIARQVSGALYAAHKIGIVHRDLKPDNIYIVPDPDVPGGERAKILDFGIAKLRDREGLTEPLDIDTEEGTVLGAPSYMAPEQCAGSGRVDHRADLYALGCILFEMVCGQPPFDGRTYGVVLAQQMRELPPTPTSIEPSVPPQLEALILRLLEKDPELRFPDAFDLLTSFHAFSGLAAPVAPQPGSSTVPNTPAGESGVKHPTVSGVVSSARRTLALGPRYRAAQLPRSGSVAAGTQRGRVSSEPPGDDTAESFEVPEETIDRDATEDEALPIALLMGDSPGSPRFEPRPMMGELRDATGERPLPLQAPYGRQDVTSTGVEMGAGLPGDPGPSRGGMSPPGFSAAGPPPPPGSPGHKSGPPPPPGSRGYAPSATPPGSGPPGGQSPFPTSVPLTMPPFTPLPSGGPPPQPSPPSQAPPFPSPPSAMPPPPPFAPGPPPPPPFGGPGPAPPQDFVPPAPPGAQTMFHEPFPRPTVRREEALRAGVHVPPPRPMGPAAGGSRGALLGVLVGLVLVGGGVAVYFIATGDESAEAEEGSAETAAGTAPAAGSFPAASKGDAGAVAPTGDAGVAAEPEGKKVAGAEPARADAGAEPASAGASAEPASAGAGAGPVTAGAGAAPPSTGAGAGDAKAGDTEAGAKVEPRPRAADAGAVATREPEEPPAEPPAEPPPEPPAEPARDAETNRRPVALITLQIDSLPRGASVIRKSDGVRLGETPFTYQTEPQRRSIAVVLRHKGYRDEVVTLPGNRSAERRVPLTRTDGAGRAPSLKD